MLVSAALSFTFGSYGDFASVLSSASTLRRALAAIAGTSKELGVLIGDIDTFVRTLQAAKATLDEAVDTPASVQNALGDALGRCYVILDDIKKKTDEYRKQLSRQSSSGYHIIRRPYAVLIWEVFGGRAGVEKIWARMMDQIHAINALLVLSLRWCALRLNCNDLKSSLFTRSDTLQRFNALQAKNITADVEEIRRTVDKIESRMYQLPRPMAYGTPFYFRGSNGQDTLPVAGLSVADFSELFEVLREGDLEVPPLEKSSMTSPLSHLHLTTFRSNSCGCSVYPDRHCVVISFHWFFHPSGSPHQTPAILISPMSFTVVREVRDEITGELVCPRLGPLEDDPGLKQAFAMMRGDWTTPWRGQRFDLSTNSELEGAATLMRRASPRVLLDTELGICISRGLRRIDTMFEWSFGKPVAVPKAGLDWLSFKTVSFEHAWFKQGNGHLGIPLRLVLDCKGDCDVISALLENTCDDIEALRDGKFRCKVIVHMEEQRRFESTVPLQWVTYTCKPATQYRVRLPRTLQAG